MSPLTLCPHNLTPRFHTPHTATPAPIPCQAGEAADVLHTPSHFVHNPSRPFHTSPHMRTCASALLWSRRVRQLMFSAGMLGAYSLRMRALVLAGLATTRICRSPGSGRVNKLGFRVQG